MVSSIQFQCVKLVVNQLMMFFDELRIQMISVFLNFINVMIIQEENVQPQSRIPKKIVQNFDQYPYSCIGTIQGKKNGFLYRGVGTYIGNNLILTCAHVLCSLSTRQFIEDIKIFFSNGEVFQATIFYINQNYIRIIQDNNSQDKHKYDWALLYSPKITKQKDYLKISRSQMKQNEQIISFTYKKANLTLSPCYSVGKVQMVDKNLNLLYHDAQTQDGDSGSPILSIQSKKFRIYGIHIGKYEQKQIHVGVLLEPLIKREIKVRIQSAKLTRKRFKQRYLFEYFKKLNDERWVIIMDKGLVITTKQDKYKFKLIVQTTPFLDSSSTLSYNRNCKHVIVIINDQDSPDQLVVLVQRSRDQNKDFQILQMSVMPRGQEVSFKLIRQKKLSNIMSFMTTENIECVYSSLQRFLADTFWNLSRYAQQFFFKEQISRYKNQGRRQ